MPKPEILQSMFGGSNIPAYPRGTTVLPSQEQQMTWVPYEGKYSGKLLNRISKGKRQKQSTSFGLSQEKSIGERENTSFYVHTDLGIPNTIHVGNHQYTPYPLRTEPAPRDSKRRKEGKKAKRKRARRLAGRLALAGLITMAAAEEINVDISNIITPAYTTSITEVMNNSPAHAEHRSATIYFGGLGQTDAITDTKQLEPAQKMRPDIVFAVGYSSNGVDIPKEANLIEEKIQQDHITEINGVGDSSGGNIMLRTFRRVKEKLKDKISFGTLTEIDSPTTSDDILNRNYHIALLFGTPHIVDLIKTGGKFIGEVYTYMISNGQYKEMLEGFITHNFSKINQQYNEALRVTLGKLTSKLWLSQLRIDATSTVDQTANDLAVIDPQNVDYVEPEVAANDTTVNVTTAVKHLDEAIQEESNYEIPHNEGKFGAGTPSQPPTKLIVIKVPHAGHASLGDTTKSYNVALGSQWAKEEQANAPTPPPSYTLVTLLPHERNSHDLPPVPVSPSSITVYPMWQNPNHSSAHVHQSEALDPATNR